MLKTCICLFCSCYGTFVTLRAAKTRQRKVGHRRRRYQRTTKQFFSVGNSFEPHPSKYLLLHDTGTVYYSTIR